MKYEVLEWHDLNDPVRSNSHRCRNVDSGEIEYIDFYTDATFPEDLPPEELVGETVNVERTFPYNPLFFAQGVTVSEEPTE